MRLVLTERRLAKERINVAIVWERAHRFREALTIYDQVAALRGNRGRELHAMALAGQATSRWGVDDYEGAIEAAEEAIALLEPLAVEKPGKYGSFLLDAWWALGIARFNLGVTHDDLGMLAEAVPALEHHLRMARIAAIEPVRNISALRALANALLDLDRPAEALPYAEEAVELLRPVAAADPETYEAELANALDLERECRDQAFRDAGPRPGT